MDEDTCFKFRTQFLYSLQMGLCLCFYKKFGLEYFIASRNGMNNDTQDLLVFYLKFCQVIMCPLSFIVSIDKIPHGIKDVL